MRHTSASLQDLLAAQRSGQGFAISASLLGRAGFLINFTPNGDIEHDMVAFLTGTGQQKMLAVSHQHGLSLRELAAAIRHNHTDELANLYLEQGGHPLWSPKEQRWTQEQIEFYLPMLTLEVEVLDSILRQDSGPSSRSGA